MALRLVLRVTKELAAREARTGRMLLLGRVGCLRHRRRAVHALAAVAAERVSHTVVVVPNKIGALAATTRHLGGCDLLVELLLILLELVNLGLTLLGETSTLVLVAQGGDPGGYLLELVLRSLDGGLLGVAVGLVHLGGRFHAVQHVGGVVGGYVGTPSAPRRGGGGGSGSGGGGSSSGSGVGGGSSGSGTTTIGLVQQLLHLLRHLAVGLNLLGGSRGGLRAIGGGGVDGRQGGHVGQSGHRNLCGRLGSDDLHQGHSRGHVVGAGIQSSIDLRAVLAGRNTELREEFHDNLVGYIHDVEDLVEHIDEDTHVGVVVGGHCFGGR